MNAISEHRWFVMRPSRPMPRACLKLLKVKLPRDTSVNGKRIKQTISAMPVAGLWDLRDQARANFILLVKRFHPDRGGDARRFAEITWAWKYLKTWFLKFGIE